MDTLLLQRSLHLFERQREREAERAGREEEIFTHMQRIAKQPPRNSDGEAKGTSVGGVCCVMYPSASSLSLSPQCCNRCGGCVASDRQPKQASDYVEEKEKKKGFCYTAQQPVAAGRKSSRTPCSDCIVKRLPLVNFCCYLGQTTKSSIIACSCWGFNAANSSVAAWCYCKAVGLARVKT